MYNLERETEIKRLRAALDQFANGGKMITPDELADRVARLYEDKWGIKDHSLARAAIAVALEEAAHLMLTRRGRWWPDEACAAIRALIKKESA